jgi:hypothetical protein
VLLAPPGVAVGCFQGLDTGSATGSGGSDLGAPAQQCAPNSAECFALCGAPLCALPDGAIPTALETPPIYNADGSTVTNPCDMIEAESMDIRRQSCAPCHGGPGAPGGNPDGFNYVMDDVALTTHLSNNYMAPDGAPFRMVIPGDPSDSWIYERMVSGLTGSAAGMPPNATQVSQLLGPEAGADFVWPTAADISVMYGWIYDCLGDGGAYSIGHYGAGGPYGPAGGAAWSDAGSNAGSDASKDAGSGASKDAGAEDDGGNSDKDASEKG